MLFLINVIKQKKCKLQSKNLIFTDLWPKTTNTKIQKNFSIPNDKLILAQWPEKDFDEIVMPVN